MKDILYLQEHAKLVIKFLVENKPKHQKDLETHKENDRSGH